MFFFTFVFLLSCGIDNLSNSNLKIINGLHVNKENEIYKSLVFFSTSERPEEPFCSGSIISKSFVLTAAHCLNDRNIKEILLTIPSSNFEKFKLKSINLFSDEKKFYPVFDIAVAELSSQITDKSFPVELFDGENNIEDVSDIVITGFGMTNLNVNSFEKKPYHTFSKFDHLFKNGPLRNLFTTNSDKGQSICHGDSGGGVYGKIKGKLVLIGINQGHDKLLKQTSDCTSQNSLHTFLGYYQSWVMKHILHRNTQSINQTKSYNSFIENCNSNDTDNESLHTVNVIMRILNTTNCDEANTKLSNKTILNLSGKNISSLKPISNLFSLKFLDISNNKIQDLSSISNLNLLEELIIRGNEIKNVDNYKFISSIDYVEKD